ncbi:MAG: hypothetical protein J6X66_08500, partial [Lachnospiraceae bacterium]|nr:hypothetical protein [Lachnospiraceae bacterium]
MKKKLRRVYLTAKYDPAEAIKSKENELERLKSEIEKRNKKLEESQKQYDKGILGKKLQDEEDAAKKKDEESRTKEYNNKDKALKAKASEISGKEKALEKAIEELVELEKNIDSMKSEIDAKMEPVRLKEADLNNARAIMQDEEKKARDARYTADISGTSIDQIQQTINTLKKNYYDTEDKKLRPSIQKQLKELRAQRDALKKRQSTLEAEYNKINKQYKKAKDAFEKEEKLYNELNDQFRQDNTEIEKKRSEYENKKKANEQLTEEIKSEMEKLTADNEQLRLAREKLASDIKAHEEEKKNRKIDEKDREKAREEEKNKLEFLKAMVQDGNVQDQDRIKVLEDEIAALKAAKENNDTYNREHIGADNLNEVTEVLKKNIDKNGVMSKELQDTLALYNTRMEMLDKTENSSISCISHLLMENDEILGALMNPAISVAKEMIRMLNERFGTVAKQLAERPEHFRALYLKGRIELILRDKDTHDEDYWKEEIRGFEEKYLKQKNAGKGSIENNRAKGEEVLKSWIKSNSKKYPEARRMFDMFKFQIDQIITQDPELFMELYTQNGAEQLYTKITKNYLPNVDEVEKAFYREMIKYEESRAIREARKRSSMEELLGNAVISDKEIKAYKKEFEEKVGEITARDAINNFKSRMLKDSLSLTTEELKNKVNLAAEEYVKSFMSVEHKDPVLKTQSDEEAKAFKEKKEKVKLIAATRKTEGQNAYDILFFGNKEIANSINELSKTGFSLAYKEFNKKAKPKDEAGTKKMLDSAYKTLSKVKENSRIPSILTDIMAEYKILEDQINDKKEDEKQKSAESEAQRLWKIYEYGEGAGSVNEKMLDMYAVYAARHWDGKKEEDLKKITTAFKNFCVSWNELSSLEIKEPAVKAERDDMCEKLMLYVFERGASLSLNDFNASVAAQTEYFKNEEKYYGIIKESLNKHKNTKDLDDLGKEQYVRGLSRHLRADMINNRKKEPDSEAIKAQIKEILDDPYLSAAVNDALESVSSDEYYEAKSYPGAVRLVDFEKKIRDMAPKDLLDEYNALSVEQRQMFAVALYSSRQEESGSLRVVFGVREEELKKNREIFKDYLKGKEVEFNVDYGRSLRKLVSKTGDMKEHLSQTMFREALFFVKKVDKKKEELRPKEWDRIDDAGTIIRSARNGLIAAQYIKDDKLIENPPKTQKAFMKMLDTIAKEDVSRRKDQGFFTKLSQGFGALKWFKGESIKDLMKTVKSLKPYQMRMLVYVLQNRSALDFTSAGKDEDTGVYEYANKKQRFKLIEELTDESKNMMALAEADSEEMLGKAMLSLMSYQLKDHEELSEKDLKESDFADGVLERPELLDWKLLLSALNLVQEVDNERLRLYMVRQSSERFKEKAEEK